MNFYCNLCGRYNKSTNFNLKLSSKTLTIKEDDTKVTPASYLAPKVEISVLKFRELKDLNTFRRSGKVGIKYVEKTEENIQKSVEIIRRKNSK